MFESSMFVEEKEKERRLAICNNCPNLYKLTGNCKLCGCFVKLKTKLKNQNCPISKW